MKKYLLVFAGLLIFAKMSYAVNSWITQYFGSATDISFPDSLHGWAGLGGTAHGISSSGEIMCTKDGGKSWTEKLIPHTLTSGYYTTRVAFVDSNFGWAGGSWYTNQTISGYTGSGWYLAATGNGFDTYSPSGHSINSHYQGGTVTNMETVAGELFWAYVNSDAKGIDYYINGKWMPFSYMAICFIDSCRGWVWCGGQFFRTTTGVNSLSPLYDFPNINDIDFIDSLQGWAVGSGGTILYTDKGGADSVWDTLSSGVTDNLKCIKFVDSLNGWVGGDGIILRTRDGGQNWVTEYSSGSSSVSKICAIDTTYAWALSDNGNILKYKPYVGIEENSKLQNPNYKLEILKNKICLNVPKSINTELKIYDLSGRLKQVVYSGILSKGDYTFTPGIHKNGIYFVRLKVGEHNITRKLILIK